MGQIGWSRGRREALSDAGDPLKLELLAQRVEGIEHGYGHRPGRSTLAGASTHTDDADVQRRIRRIQRLRAN